MIRIGLVTSWGDRCGTSEHAKNIQKYCVDPEIEITIVSRSLADYVYHDQRRFDVVHVNESGFVLGGFDPVQINILKQRGMKTVLTMNASSPENNWNPFTRLFDKVTMFEPRTNDGYEYVPIGAPVCDPQPKAKDKIIVTNGFPQERKNLRNLAEACEATGYALMALIPESPHADARAVGNELKRINPAAIVSTEWFDDQTMVQAMSNCTLACYPYLEWFQGSSSAAMFGVSARLPLMVSRANQFNFLFPREDVYFIESARPSAEEIVAAIRKTEEDDFNKSTEQLYQTHRMDLNLGRRYAEIYKGVMA